jgi:hypothetical protein
MTMLLVVIGALIAVLIVQSILDPWAPSPATQEADDQAAAEARAREMETIALSCF